MATKFDDVKPWPTKPAAPQAAGSVQGHNRPPLDIEARAAFDEVLDQRDGFRDRVKNLIAASDRAVATDEVTAGKCGDLVKQIRAAQKVVDDAHTTTKAPYLAAGRAVDAAKNEQAGPLSAAKAKVEAKQAAFLREEDRRRQAEARRAREAEEARRREEWERQKAAAEASSTETEAVSVTPFEPAPPPPPAIEPEREIIRGDFGAAVSGTKVWLSQVTDYEVAFIAAGLAKNEKVREAIDKAVANQVRGGVREIEGVRVWSDIKASNR
ncbi:MULTISPECIES: hypothetical protein [unclassified Sphingomonas]|uniref:hypothetical protein n=1 Tax=unclassified Sphingomonas TaxID=196159 RepID=UPI0006F2A0B0|nr:MULTISPECIES: hypothetical protein [unclassified Sphingomonas]KQX18380.1 hypothetical protein ASD17_14560 [Sphingomonas sp. Root1294]KQY72295.1 hypothetical protein ASD39_20415 [Sphingomonas sp. Root50]KRB94434.1 hypothetical protein ASE22_00335 [Sphingomonas sp. Root720]